MASSNCFNKVKQQVSAEFLQDSYSIEMTNDKSFKISEDDFMSDTIYETDDFDTSAVNEEDVYAYHADSSAMGCYGFEYVIYQKSTCKLLAVGGGYCD
jgi:hypothetical protein